MGFPYLNPETTTQTQQTKPKQNADTTKAADLTLRPRCCWVLQSPGTRALWTPESGSRPDVPFWFPFKPKRVPLKKILQPSAFLVRGRPILLRVFPFCPSSKRLQRSKMVKPPEKKGVSLLSPHQGEKGTLQNTGAPWDKHTGPFHVSSVSVRKIRCFGWKPLVFDRYLDPISGRVP